MDITEIKEELTALGHKVRNIINAKQRGTKEPLFFVDLEPPDNNRDTYKVKKLNSIILIEPPRKDKNIVQCMRCQQYGHTKTYCNKPFVCVKCEGTHSTTDCKKSADTPATCASCRGPHPASFRGCEYYHRFFQHSHNNTNNHIHQSTAYIIPNSQQPTMSSNLQQRMSYASVARDGDNNIIPTQNNNENGSNADISGILGKFLDEFKSLFNQLLQQNSVVLNILTMIINKK